MRNLRGVSMIHVVLIYLIIGQQGNYINTMFPAGAYEVTSTFKVIEIFYCEGYNGGVYCELAVIQIVPEKCRSMIRDNGLVVLELMGGGNISIMGGYKGWIGSVKLIQINLWGNL